MRAHQHDNIAVSRVILAGLVVVLCDQPHGFPARGLKPRANRATLLRQSKPAPLGHGGGSLPHRFQPLVWVIRKWHAPLEKIIHELRDWRAAPKVGRKLKLSHLGTLNHLRIAAHKPPDRRQVRAAKPIDGLLEIPHEKAHQLRVARLAAQQALQQVQLQGIRILKLIHQDRPKLLPLLPAHGIVFAQQPRGQAHHIVEGHYAQFAHGRILRPLGKAASQAPPPRPILRVLFRKAFLKGEPID